MGVTRVAFNDLEINLTSVFLLEWISYWLLGFCMLYCGNSLPLNFLHVFFSREEAWKVDGTCPAQ